MSLSQTPAEEIDETIDNV